MLFTSETFLFLFLPGLLLVYFLVPDKKINLKNIVLLLFSVLFYTWGEQLLIIILFIEILIGWMVGKILCSQIVKMRKVVFLSAVLSIIGILFYYKYFNFAGSIFSDILGIAWEEKDIRMPLGISFFSFQVLSYVIDCYRKNNDKPGSFLEVALYVSMFPQLVAGPIVRYSDIADQLRFRQSSKNGIIDGMSRFSIGLMKKVLLANQLAYVAQICFDNYNTFSSVSLWLGSIAYTLQILFDFSGYSDMAIGLGNCFGFKYPENFNMPYTATSLTDFWRRWHMTLSQWFRDYVYIPLGGNRCSIGKNIRNLFVVWLLTGLWHGANWTFVFWGLSYFVLLMVERSLKLTQKKGIIMRLYILLAINLLWVVFNSESLKQAWIYIARMFGGYHSHLWDDTTFFILREWWLIFTFALLAASSIVPILSKKLKQTGNKLVIGMIAIVNAVGVFVTITYVIKGSYNPFIYFNF